MFLRALGSRCLQMSSSSDTIQSLSTLVLSMAWRSNLLRHCYFTKAHTVSIGLNIEVVGGKKRTCRPSS